MPPLIVTHSKMKSSVNTDLKSSFFTTTKKTVKPKHPAVKQVAFDSILFANLAAKKKPPASISAPVI